MPVALVYPCKPFYTPVNPYIPATARAESGFKTCLLVPSLHTVIMKAKWRNVRNDIRRLTF